jgi:hypothetical protein
VEGSTTQVAVKGGKVILKEVNVWGESMWIFVKLFLNASVVTTIMSSSSNLRVTAPASNAVITLMTAQ